MKLKSRDDDPNFSSKRLITAVSAESLQYMIFRGKKVASLWEYRVRGEIFTFANFEFSGHSEKLREAKFGIKRECRVSSRRWLSPSS